MTTARSWRKYGIGLLLTLCLLICAIKLPAFAITQQVALVGNKAVYMDGEKLQIQARLVPPQGEISWTWECRLPGETESTVIGTADKLTLNLTMMHHGAVLCPVATLADGTVVRGPEKTLVVELYCIGLEIGRLPEKTAYAPGTDFEPAGLQILAQMSDGSRRDVTELCSYAPLTLDLDTEQVLATCRLRGGSGALKGFDCSIPVTVELPEQPGDSDGAGDANPDGTGDTDPDGQNPDSGTTTPGSGEQQQPGGSGSQQQPGQDPGNSGSGDATGGTNGESGDTDSGEDLPGSEQQKPEAPDAQPGQGGPSWSKSMDQGVILGVALLILCAGMVIALWWVLRREDPGEPPAP